MDMKQCIECGQINDYDDTECTRCGCVAFTPLPYLTLASPEEMDEAGL